MSILQTVLSVSNEKPPKTFNTYKEVLDDLKDNFIMTPKSARSKSEMEQYLTKTLTNSFPNLDISLSVEVKADNSIYITHLNDFNNQLKLHYPEALFG